MPTANELYDLAVELRDYRQITESGVPPMPLARILVALLVVRT